MRFLSALSLSLSLCQTFVGCTSAPQDEKRSLVVFAAASMTDVLVALERDFETTTGIDVRASFGATSDLARQIHDGAPADVFVAAGTAWVDHLRLAGRVLGSPRVIGRNRLVCIVPVGSPLVARGVDDLRSFAKYASTNEIRVGIGFDGVPAGDFTREALGRARVWSDLEGAMVGQKDVRAVLRAVQRGALDAGFVYSTDVTSASVAVLFEIDPALHSPVEVLALVPVTTTDRTLAERYLTFLSSEPARRELSARGFTVP